MDFAARKLPEAGEMDAIGPPCYQERVILLDDGRDDNDRGIQ